MLGYFGHEIEFGSRLAMTVSGVLLYVVGASLYDVAATAESPQRRGLLKNAVAASRAALEVFTREAFPLERAMTQNNLAIAVWLQAAEAEGPQKSKLLGEAVATYRAALEV